MLPVLVKLGPITIHTYGFLFAIGVLMAILLTLHLSKKRGLDTKVVADFVFITILIGLLGAKIFLFVTEINHYLKYPGEIKYLLTSGGTFYGGLIFGALFAVWYIRKHNLNYRILGDIAAPAIALAHFFGRLGCFSAGCCYGREAHESFFGVTYHSTYAHQHTGVPLDISVYPTQLVEAILNLLNFIILITLYKFKKKRFEGQIFILYVFNYSIIRFAVEFFRGDHDRGYIFGGIDHPFSSLSAPQLISIIGVIISIVLYKIFKKKGEQHRSRNQIKG